MITTRAFWLGCAERAVKTWIQSFVAVLFVAGVAPAAVSAGDFLGLPWLTAVVTASLATLLSVATSIGNADFTAGVQPRRAAGDGEA